MTSQLNVVTIVDKAGTGGANIKIANTSTHVSDGGNVTQNTVQGLAKQWTYYNMASTTILDSLNTSSLTDYATGRFHPVVTSAFNNLNYVTTYSTNGYAGDSFNAGTVGSVKIGWEITTTTSTYETVCYYTSGYVDGKHNYVLAHGDLA